jgi:RNA polymerase sigma-70 factor (ECF subfamily)
MDEQRLSRIATQWSVVRQAHASGVEHRHAAQRELLERYGGAVRRYLLAALRDADAADEVFQEFALRFVRGDLRSADPGHGRFRSFLKTVISRMVTDYHRRRQRRERQVVASPLDHGAVEAAAAERPEPDFSASWREDLLARAWQQLRELEAESGRPYFTVLHHRVHHAGANSQILAVQLAQLLGRPLTAGNVRVLVHRARDRFAEFLLSEVAGSVGEATLDQVEQELIDLRLHEYCREVLQRRRDRQPADPG